MLKVYCPHFTVGKLFSILSLISYSLFLLPSSAIAALGDGPAGVLQLQELIRRIINISVGIGFMFVTVMLVVAGIKYLVSGGEPKALGSAAGTVTWALLGALFLALAWIIMLLIKALTGVDILNFCIGFPGVIPACDFK